MASENEKVNAVAEALGINTVWTNGMEDIDEDAERQGRAVKQSRSFQLHKPNKPRNANCSKV